MDIEDVKDNFEMGALYAGFVVGGIVIAPFYGVYLIGKGVYYYLPSSIRKRKMEVQQEKDEKEKAKQRDAEIEELEKKMGLTRRQISRLKYIPDGITLNHRQVRTDALAHPGDTVCAALDLGRRFIPTSDDFTRIPLDILAEREDWIALAKPSGMTLHPTHGHYYDTMSVQLNALLSDQGRACSLHTIGRLDKDTTGIQLFAKNPIAAARLTQQRACHQLQKEYVALVHGICPQQGVIDTPIARTPDALNHMECSPQGKAAHTAYTRLAHGENHSLVRLKLNSGRTHQIRVHMASIGHPLLGDPIYGIRDDIPRLCLHADTLRFLDPFSENEIILHCQDDSFTQILNRSLGPHPQR